MGHSPTFQLTRWQILHPRVFEFLRTCPHGYWHARIHLYHLVVASCNTLKAMASGSFTLSPRSNFFYSYFIRLE